MKQVLVTGAGGFIGRHVCDALLKRGFDVHAVSQRDHVNVAQLTWHKLDLFDVKATEDLLAELRCTHLIHLAWVTTPGDYWQSTENDLWQNASVKLLNSFQKNAGERAILAGTCAEYDWTDGHCIAGVTPSRALSPYTTSKLAFRADAQAAAESKNLSMAWARIFFPFGPHEPIERLVPSIIRPILAGERAACSDGGQVRDFIYVRDVADALVTLLDDNFSGDINIASGHAIEIKTLVNMIADKLDARDKIDFGALPRQAGDPAKITADVSQLRDTIGWTPGYDLETAIDETIAWWRERTA